MLNTREREREREITLRLESSYLVHLKSNIDTLSTESGKVCLCSISCKQNCELLKINLALSHTGYLLVVLFSEDTRSRSTGQ